MGAPYVSQFITGALWLQRGPEQPSCCSGYGAARDSRHAGSDVAEELRGTAFLVIHCHAWPMDVTNDRSPYGGLCIGVDISAPPERRIEGVKLERLEAFTNAGHFLRRQRHVIRIRPHERNMPTVPCDQHCVASQNCTSILPVQNGI